MENLDLMNQKKAEIMNRINQAIKDNNEEAFSASFDEFTNLIQEAVMEEAQGLRAAADSNILRGRGVRQLTSEEHNYYQEVMQAMRSSNPKQALTDLDAVMPKTVIDTVFEDLKEEHELLELINFQNTSGLVEFLVNKNPNQMAKWGILTGKIEEELTSGFKKIIVNLNKLSAFLPISKSMLDLGPEWLDRYVRAILSEALANGLEEGMVGGTGKDMPIGMNRQVGDDVTVVGGVYPLKELVPLTSLSPEAYGDMVARLAITPNGHTRKVLEVILIVNPVDYLKKIMPATTVRGANGTYVNNVFPFPTKPIQSTHVEVGKAILGLPSRYFMGVGTEKSGKIEMSDEYKFLDDERVYLVKLYGHGEPMDNNAFIYLDISDLKPANHQVVVVDESGDPMPVYYPVFDARLSALTIGSLDLDPVFNKSVFNYSVTTTNATNTINATALADEGLVEITVNDVEVENGASATWTTGDNDVVINVTSGTETETYRVTVTKQ